MITMDKIIKDVNSKSLYSEEQIKRALKHMKFNQSEFVKNAELSYSLENIDEPAEQLIKIIDEHYDKIEEERAHFYKKIVGIWSFLIIFTIVTAFFMTSNQYVDLLNIALCIIINLLAAKLNYYDYIRKNPSSFNKMLCVVAIIVIIINLFRIPLFFL